MMFPFALTLYSAAVHDMLERHGADLADSIRNHYGYEHGYKTVLNVLRLGDESACLARLPTRARGLRKLLTEGLASSKTRA